MRSKPVSLLLLLAIGSAAMSCVSMKKYRALEDNLRGTESTLAERDAQVKDRDAQIQDRNAQLEKERGSLGALEAELKSCREGEATLHKAIEKAEADKNSLLAAKGRLSADIEGMRVALREMEARKNAAEERVQAYRDLLARFKKLIDAGKLKVKIIDGNMVVELANDILFPSGSADLSADGKTAIVEVAQVLASIPDRSFQVAGHTDNKPIKSEKYPSNWELAASRAITVVNTMVDAGMPPQRISAASFGQYRPAAANDTPQNRAVNRRIQIVVMPDLSDLPGYNELQSVSKEK